MRTVKISSRKPKKWILAYLILSINFAIPSQSFALSNEEARILEEEIADSNSDTQSKLEIRIARILQSDPSSIQANYLMSTLLLKMFTQDPGSYALIRQSTELAAQIYDLDKKSDLAIAALANILEVSGENSRGLALINESRKRGTSLGWRTRLTEARLLYNEKDYKRALALLDTNLKDVDVSKSLQSQIVINIVTEFYKGKAHLEALADWKKKNGTTSIALAFANSLALMNKLGDAKIEYERILKIDPHNSEAFLSLGIIENRAHKDSPMALKRFKEAVLVAKNPTEKTAAQTHLALALISQKNSSSEVIDASVNAIKDSADREGVLVALANSHLRNSSTATILTLLEKVEEGTPELSLAHALKGEILSERLGKHQEAKVSFSNAIALDKNRSEYYNGRGLSNMQMGQLGEALLDFESATIVNPEDASSRYNFACALARLGRSDEAITSLTQAINMDGRLKTHAMEDTDLVSLRTEPNFQEMVNKTSVGH